MSSERPNPEPILSVRGLSKCYRLYHRRADRVKQVALGRWKRFYEPFWALDDVSFDLQRGEALGILGVNGSGKSTLLQVIAGTTVPSKGTATVRGRVAALLELGSGFNHQFTGRENVYMAGAIQGISKREMDRRFDEIAEFADIGQFIDQPVSLYSSGMRARLAFAVAVAVQPEILILDEILAVGDMGFQQKCVSRIRSMLHDGVSLLFVSHSANSVKSLCAKGLVLSRGQMLYFGSADDAVNRYVEHLRLINNGEALKTQRDMPEGLDLVTDIGSARRYGSGHAQIESVRMLDGAGGEVTGYQVGERVNVEVTIRAFTDVDRVDLAFIVRDRSGIDLIGGVGTDYGGLIPPLKKGERARILVSFACAFRPGPYAMTLTLTRVESRPGELGLTLDHLDACASFAVLGDHRHNVRYMFHQPASFNYEKLRAEAGQHLAEKAGAS